MTALRWGSATDTGRVRSINQDAALADGDDDLFAVADGMGGHVAGEVAAQVAVEALKTYAEPTRDGMVRAVRLANRAVWARADDEPELRGMGTTITALRLLPTADAEAANGGGDGEAPGGTEEQVVILNVGDSRAYLYRDDQLTQLTDDHSLVGEYLREGRLTVEEARTHPQRNILTRALGNEPDVEVDVFTVSPFRGDRYVLCSDGLFSEVHEDRIAAALRRLAEPEEAARELVRLANDEGGRDNITVVVVDVVDDGGKAEQASEALAADATTVHPALAGAAVGASRNDVAAKEAPARPPTETGTDEEPSAKERRRARRERRRTGPRARRVTWRSVVFVLAVLGVLAAAAGAVAWFARSSWFVGTDGDEVVIYRGRPGGVLWIDPTVEERTGLTLDDIPEARVADVQDGEEENSLDDARGYVENLREQAEADEERRNPGERRTTTTTTTSTTSTTTSTRRSTTTRP